MSSVQWGGIMKHFLKIIVGLGAGLSLSLTTASAEELSPGTTDHPATAQTSVAAGPQWIFGYSYYKYDLQGSRAANNGIYKFGQGSVDLQVLSATWLYSARWTFVAIAPWIKSRVETIYEPGHLNLMTTDQTQGLGDLRMMGISPLLAQDAHLWMYDVSVTLPTGSTNENFSSDLAQSLHQRASYNMQPGSGTPDLIVGSTYSYTLGSWVQSARGQVTVRGGKNAEGWNLGTEYQASLSSKYQVDSYLNVGVAGSFKSREAVQGRDEKYEINNHYNDPSTGISGDGHQYYHAYQTNWETDLVAKLQSPSWSHFSASLEGGLPFWQGFINKDNIDLNVKYWLAASLTAVF